MAVATGPLMSTSASGTICHTLIYVTRNGVTTVYCYAVPTDKNTPAQALQRAHFLDAARLWNFLSDTERAFWKVQYSGLKATPYGVFAETIMNRMLHDPNWLQENAFSYDRSLLNFILIHPMELAFGSVILDCSGFSRHITPSASHRDLDDRGYALHIVALETTSYATNSANLGDKSQFAIAVRIKPDVPQSTISALTPIIANMTDTSTNGFRVDCWNAGIRCIIHNAGKASRVYHYVAWNVGKWSDLIISFDSTASPKMKSYFNGNAGTLLTDNATAVGTSATNIYIGNWSDGKYFPGHIDSVALKSSPTNVLQI